MIELRSGRLQPITLEKGQVPFNALVEWMKSHNMSVVRDGKAFEESVWSFIRSWTKQVASQE
jgi:hypothetical protein